MGNKTDEKKSSGIGSVGWLAVVAVVVGIKLHKEADAPRASAPPPAANASECMEQLSQPAGASPLDEARRLLRATLRPYDAEDIAMDALLRVCSRNPPGDLRQYYLGAVHRMKANPFRQSVRDARKVERYLHDQWACPARHVDPVDAIASAEMQSLVHRWLKDLTIEEVELLNQHVFEQLSFSEIERNTGVARSTLSDRWAKLRKKIEAQVFACALATMTPEESQEFLRSVAAPARY